MGAKSRATMAEAAARLEARKAETLGPSAPPCENPKCNPFGKAGVSTGTVLVRLPKGGSVLKNVCGPLRCAWDVAGDLSASASFAPHAPGRYRGA